MMIDLGNGLMWDDTKGPFEQTEELQQLFSVAIFTTPQRTFEVCLENKRRTTSRTYQFNESYAMVETPVYNNPPDSKEFMGVSTFIYTFKLIDDAK